MPISWLDRPVEEVEPELKFGGGGMFDPFGNYGETIVKYGYRCLMPEKPVEGEHFPDCFPDFYRRSGGGENPWYAVYWNIANIQNAKVGLTWAKGKGLTNFDNPQKFVVTSTKTTTMLNWTDETREKFTSDFLVNDYQIGQTLHGQWGAMYHMIWVPSMLCAIAMYLRSQDHPLFANLPDLSFPVMEIVRKDSEIDVGGENTVQLGSDEAWFHLIGDHTERNRDHELHPLNSLFGKRRTELFNQLGEEDGGVLSPDQTKSEILSTCLTFALAGWTEHTWSKTVRVFDPHPNHINKNSGEQLDMTIVTTLFPDEKEAQKACDEEQERREGLIAKANGEVSGFGEYQTQEAFLEALATTLYETYKIDAMPKKLKEKKAFESETLPEIASELGVEVDIIKSNLDNAFELM